eukprot:7116474-Pyramimonas_sp.AAC.1
MQPVPRADVLCSGCAHKAPQTRGGVSGCSLSPKDRPKRSPTPLACAGAPVGCGLRHQGSTHHQGRFVS